MKIGLVLAVTNLLIPYVLFTFAYEEASAGFVGLFAALIPLATAVYAHFMLTDERLNTGKIIGLAIGFTGVAALLISGDSGLGSEGRPLVAAVLALISVAAIGYAGAYAKRYAGRYDPLEITGLQFSLSTVILIPAMLWFEGLPEFADRPRMGACALHGRRVHVLAVLPLLPPGRVGADHHRVAGRIPRPARLARRRCCSSLVSRSSPASSSVEH